MLRSLNGWGRGTHVCVRVFARVSKRESVCVFVCENARERGRLTVCACLHVCVHKSVFVCLCLFVCVNSFSSKEAPLPPLFEVQPQKAWKRIPRKASTTS